MAVLCAGCSPSGGDAPGPRPGASGASSSAGDSGAGSATTGAKPTNGKRPVVALVMKSLANEFFQTMAEGAKRHQAAHGDQYELVVNGIKNETDLGEQVAIVEQMVARNVDAIVIAPADSKALVPALRRAQEAGVLVINIDNKLDDAALADAQLKAPFVGPDNRAGARAVGEALAKRLKAGDKVAILEGVPTAFNSQQRRQGFEDAAKAAQWEIVSVQSGSWETDKANAIAAALLTEHPDLKALMCANDSMALGAVAAAAAANRTAEVAVVGFDNIAAVRPLLDEGKLVATADQHGDQLAVYGIEAALQVLAGKQAAENQTTAVDVVVGKSR
ncbi:MAG: sugar ABC transporter substrate-binding protein [Pirellulales bacterium]